MQKYYAVLEVEPGSDTETIRNAYRRLVRLYHPDVNQTPGAEQKIKELNEAYTFLSKMGQENRPPDPEPTWEAETDAEADSSEPAETRQERGETASTDSSGESGRIGDVVRDLVSRVTRPRSVQQIPIQLTLEEAFSGTRRIVQASADRFEVRIPAGMQPGDRIKISGPVQSGAPTIELVVNIAQHPNLTVRGHDLHTVVDIDLYSALLGGEVRVSTLRGALALTVPPSSQNGQTFRLKGQGLYKGKEKKQRGDLLVEMNVRLPLPLDAEERRLFESLRRRYWQNEHARS